MKTKKLLLVALSLLLSLFLLSCSVSYKEYRTDENRARVFDVGGKTLSAYFFVVEDEEKAVFELCDTDGKVTQSFEFPFDGNDYYTSLDFEFAFDGVAAQDMNFDGENDLYIPLSVTTPNLEGMAWLWDSKEECFVLSEELSALYELTVYPEDKIIASQDYTADNGILCKEFTWEDGKLVQTGEYTITGQIPNN